MNVIETNGSSLMLLQLLQINVKVDFLQILHHQLSKALANIFSGLCPHMKLNNDAGLAKNSAQNFGIDQHLRRYNSS